MQWWENLGEQDKRFLLIAAPIVVVLLVYALVIDPWMNYIKQLKQRVQNQQAIVQWMRTAAFEVESLRQQQAPVRQATLLATIDALARQAGLQQKILRSEPDGNEAVRLTMEDLPFDDLIRWLVQLQREALIVVRSITVLAKDTPGMVQVRLELEGR